MATKLLVIQAAALSRPPNVDGLEFRSIGSVFPALTCSVQASFRTACPPSNHGMIANGLFARRGADTLLLATSGETRVVCPD